MSASNAQVKTICPFCAIGCSLYLTFSNGVFRGIRPDFRSPVNEGCVCVKGMHAGEFINHQDRIRFPLVRVGEKFFKISWNEAYHWIAQGFSSFTPSEIVVLGSGLCTNEDNYVLSKFAKKVLGCNQKPKKQIIDPDSLNLVDYRDFTSRMSLSDITSASVIVSLYDNLCEEYPLIGRYIIEAQERGAIFISADVRLTLTGRVSDLFLEVYPMEKGELLRALILGDTTVGSSAGISEELIQKTSDIITLGKEKGQILVFGPRLDIPECHDFAFFSTFRECNTHGFLDLSGIPSSNFRDSSSYHALYLMGGNPVALLPTTGSDKSNMHKKLKKFSFVVVQDLFLTETNKHANVILPAASFAEKDGTFTNMEGRVQRIRAVPGSIDEMKPDWQIVCELAQSMGYHDGFSFSSPEEVFDEIQREVPLYQGISWEETGKPGGAFIRQAGMKKKRTTKKNSALTSKATFGQNTTYRSSKSGKKAFYSPNERYPLWLATGPDIWHTLTRTRTSRSPSLFVENDGYVMIHVDDARERDIVSGDQVRVVSPFGHIVCLARVVKEIKCGVTWMPSFLSKGETSLLDGRYTAVWISRCEEK